jgi:hypothetical protein
MVIVGAALIVEVAERRVAELRVGVAERLQGSRERFEERLQRRQAARLGVGRRAREPRLDRLGHQKVSVPRTLIGIMWTLWLTGVAKLLTTYLNEMSKPIGPDVTPPPPSAK